MSSTGILPRAISLDEFIPLIGRVLLANCNPRMAELMLVKVTPYPRQGSARIAFDLIFRSSSEIQLVAGMYPLRCGEFGPVLVHMEPVMPPQDAGPGNYYQALFN